MASVKEKIACCDACTHHIIYLPFPSGYLTIRIIPINITPVNQVGVKSFCIRILPEQYVTDVKVARAHGQ